MVYEQAHEILVSSRAKGLNFGLSLPLLPYSLYASSQDSGKTVHMRSLARVFAAHICNKYQNLICWLSSLLYFFLAL